MKKIFAKFLGKETLSYTDKAVSIQTPQGVKKEIDWQLVNKLVFVSYFEEYSGYFLTEDYKNKVLYNDISIDCNRNIVKVRTGGSPSIKKNTSKPFSKQFGTTLINDVVFVEYLNSENTTNLYAVHYKSADLKNIKKELEGFTKKENVFIEERIEGFSFIAEI